MRTSEKTRSRFRLRTLLLAAAALAGLVAVFLWQTRGSWWSPFDRYAHLDSVDAAEALRSAFKSTDQLTFLSWDGVWQGRDVDTELTLLPDRTLTIKHFGYAVDSVTGTYLTEGSLILVDVDFSKLVGMRGAEDWPPLRVKIDGTDLLLIPDRETAALSRSEWPLRRIE